MIVSLPLVSCSSDAIAPISFGRFGPSSGDSGRGSFRFGVATAATQIEDMNTATDWYLWTRPEAMGGLGHGAFVGDATRGYSRAMDGFDLDRFCPRVPAPCAAQGGPATITLLSR